MKELKRSFYKEKLKINYNPDTDSEKQDKIEKNTNNIIDYLFMLGEKSASEFLLETKNTPNYSENIKELEIIETRNGEKLKTISETNSGILEKLDEIQRKLVDNQDTSVSQIQDKGIEKYPSLEELKMLYSKNNQQKPEDKSSSWFSSMLAGLIGGGLLAFLIGFKSLGPVKFAMKLMELGWDFIKKKVIAVATSIAGALIKPISDVLKFVVEKLDKLPGLNGIKDKINKMFSKDDATKSTETGKGKTVSEVDKVDKGKTVSEVDKVDKGKTVIKSATPEAVAKSTEKQVAKKIGGAVAKSAMKKIPFVGVGVAAGLAATRIGDGDYIGAGMEMASGIASIIPFIGTGISLGIDAGLALKDNYSVQENDARIQKMINDGIIDSDYFGDDEIDDWEKVHNLSIDDLRALTGYQKLDEEERNKISGILYKKLLEQVKEPEDPSLFNNGFKIVFNDRESLADNLLVSNNKLQNFLMKNPLIEENVEKTEKTINGEKVIEIKYKDAELNAEYLKLKEEYDQNYKKYRESRRKELESMSDVVDIEGNLMTEQQYTEYKNNPAYANMSLSQYSESLNTRAAESDVINRLSEEYKNITLPTGEIAERIKNSEGLSLTAYRDAGGSSIGYGHFIKPGEEWMFDGITKEQAEAIFAKDFEIHLNEARQIPSFSEHPKEIQDVLTDMTFNMGGGWHKSWPTFIKNLQEKKYEENSRIIRGSLYATQVKGRALVNAKVFENESTKAVKTASGTIKESETDKKVADVNINKLDKPDSIQTKDKKVKEVQETSLKLTETAKTQNINIVNNTNTNINKSSKVDQSSISLMQLHEL